MADNRRVYVDSCCFIDMVRVDIGLRSDGDRELDVWYLKRLLEANRDREVDIFTSTLAIAECMHVGEQDVSADVKSRFDRLLLSGQYVKLVQVTPFIAQDARDLRWVHGIAVSGADGLHVASAISMKCEEFISADKRLSRAMKYRDSLFKLGISPVSGRDTQCLPVKYRQEGMKFDKTIN